APVLTPRWIIRPKPDARRKGPQFGAFLPASPMYFCSGQPTHFCSGVDKWERTQVQTVRWRLFQTAGKIVRHGRQTFLKINSAMLAVFTAIRERCARFMQEGCVMPEAS